MTGQLRALVINALRAEIIITEAQVAYYDRLKYSTGGYILTAGADHVIVRGPVGGHILARADDGLRSASNFITQKEAEKVAAKWNTGRDVEDPTIVHWTSRDAGVRALLRSQQRELKRLESLVDPDPWFDGSGPGQDWDVNGPTAHG